MSELPRKYFRNTSRQASVAMSPADAGGRPLDPEEDGARGWWYRDVSCGFDGCEYVRCEWMPWAAGNDINKASF